MESFFHLVVPNFFELLPWFIDVSISLPLSWCQFAGNEKLSPSWLWREEVGLHDLRCLPIPT